MATGKGVIRSGGGGIGASGGGADGASGGVPCRSSEVGDGS